MNKINLALAALALISLPATAAKKQVRVSAHISIEGRPVSTPRISTMMGEKATIKQSSAEGEELLGLSVTPELAKDHTDRIQLKLEFFGKRFGSKKESVVLRYGEEVPLTFYSGNGELVEATVKIQRL